MVTQRAIEERVIPGSGNVFADLGFRNARDLQLRGWLILRINAVLVELKLTRAAAAKVLGIHKADVSSLLRGEFIQGFTTERLLQLLSRLAPEIGKRRGRPQSAPR